MNSSTTSINPKITKAAEELWDYMKMNQALKPVDIIFVLGNRDDRVANYAAELYDKGLSGQMLVSGGIAHQNDLLKSKWADETEADHFAGILIKQGVPSKSILLEPKATNTGENMRFSYELLMKNNMHPRSILIV